MPEYETKTLRFHLEYRGQYLYVLMTRFWGSKTILDQVGYGGGYILFVGMGMGSSVKVADTNLYEFAQKHPFPMTELYPFDLLYALDTGTVDWDQIEDGDELTEADVEALLENGGEGEDA